MHRTEDGLSKYNALLGITEKMKALVQSGGYDKLSALFNERQGLLEEIQKIDTPAEGSILQSEKAKVKQRIIELDRDIALLIACEISGVADELKAVKRGKEILKAYRFSLFK